MRSMFVTAVAVMLLLTTASLLAEPEAEQQQVKINAWSILPESGKKQLHLQLAKDFEKENPNATIVWNFIPQGDMEKKLPTAIAMGEAPDVWSQSYRTVSEFQKHLAPMTDADAKFMGYGTVDGYLKSWEAGTLDSYSIGKNIYGLPWQYDLYGYIINTEHFIAAGLDPNKDYPKYWDDVIKLGKKLTITEGGRIKRQAVSFPYANPAIWYFMMIQPMLMELKSPVMNADGTECLINSEGAVRAVSEIKRWFDEGIADRNISATNEYVVLCQQGQVSMFVGNVVEAPKAYGVTNPIVKGKLKAIPNPTFPGTEPASGVGSWAYAVNAVSKIKPWAWKFADYIAKDPMLYMDKLGALIPRQGWSQSELVKQLDDPALIVQMQKNTYPSGLLKDFTTVSEPIKTAIQSILYENKDIRSTLDAVKKAVDAAIKK